MVLFTDTSVFLGHAFFDLRQAGTELLPAKAGHPNNGGGVRSVVKEHVPEHLCANIRRAELRVQRFVEGDLRCEQLRNGVCGTVFYLCQFKYRMGPSV